MVNKPKSKIIKTEIVQEEEDLDCFGNYDVRELLTCQKCALKDDCSIVTEKIKSERFDFRPRLKQVIGETKEQLKESPKVVELIRKIKIKQKKLEKTMSKIVKKKSDESSEEETKVVKKKVSTEEETLKKKIKKSEDSEERPEKKAGRPKTRPDVPSLGKSSIPVAFKALYSGMKELGTPEHKESITNIRGENGILFCIPKSGRTEDKIEVFVNRSGEYKFKEGKHTEHKTSKKGGETIIVVKATEKSMSEALEKLGQWKKDQPKHLASHTGKKGPKKESGGDKKDGKKLVKKSKEEEKTEKKLVKKSSKEEKPEKKGAPVIKPSKKKVVVEDEEG